MIAMALIVLVERVRVGLVKGEILIESWEERLERIISGSV